MGNAETASLHTLFALECDGHLHAIAAQRPALAGSDVLAREAAFHSLEASLHTLAGAARSVELLDLEYLCRALEALARANGAQQWDTARLDLLNEAVTLAPHLLDPGPRVRNQMLALVARCAAIEQSSGAAR